MALFCLAPLFFFEITCDSLPVDQNKKSRLFWDLFPTFCQTVIFTVCIAFTVWTFPRKVSVRVNIYSLCNFSIYEKCLEACSFIAEECALE